MGKSRQITAWALTGSAILLAYAAPRSAQADAQSDGICSLDDTTTISRTHIKRVPGYFFRQIPWQNAVGYASDGQNYYLDLSTGKEIELPGPYDPVPTPDGKLMIIPGLQFYNLGALTGGNKQPAASDNKMSGSYQSAGTLSTNGNVSRYRVIIANKFRDYTVTHGPNGKETFVPDPAGPKDLCPNVDYNKSLPMVSKDGTEVSLLNTKTQTTQIYKINPATGKCTLEEDLGIFTGKVDFSYDGKRLVFHVSNNDRTGNTDWFSVPSDDMVENVYVYDRAKHQIRRVTRSMGNAVYPNFRPDGKIVYLQHDSASDGTTTSSFVVADPDRTHALPISYFNAGCADAAKSKQFNSLVALGSLWSNLCSKYGSSVSANSAALSTMSLNPAKCRDMVTRYWNATRAQVVGNGTLAQTSGGRVTAETLSALTPADLQAACPGGNLAAVQPTVVGAAAPVQSGHNAAIPSQCISCHPRLPWDDLSQLRGMKAASGKPMIDEIRERLNLPPDDPRHMPRAGGELGADEKKRFEDYLGPAAPPASDTNSGVPVPPTPNPEGVGAGDDSE